VFVGALTLPLLTDSLKFVFSIIKRMWPKWNYTEFFPSRWDFVI